MGLYGRKLFVSLSECTAVSIGSSTVAYSTDIHLKSSVFKFGYILVHSEDSLKHVNC